MLALHLGFVFPNDHAAALAGVENYPRYTAENGLGKAFHWFVADPAAKPGAAD